MSHWIQIMLWSCLCDNTYIKRYYITVECLDADRLRSESLVSFNAAYYFQFAWEFESQIWYLLGGAINPVVQAILLKLKRVFKILASEVVTIIG